MVTLSMNLEKTVVNIILSRLTISMRSPVILLLEASTFLLSSALYEPTSSPNICHYCGTVTRTYFNSQKKNNCNNLAQLQCYNMHSNIHTVHMEYAHRAKTPLRALITQWYCLCLPRTRSHTIPTNTHIHTHTCVCTRSRSYQACSPLRVYSSL